LLAFRKEAEVVVVLENTVPIIPKLYSWKPVFRKEFNRQISVMVDLIMDAVFP
jgi:hypothetical protein